MEPGSTWDPENTIANPSPAAQDEPPRSGRTLPFTHMKIVDQIKAIANKRWVQGSFLGCAGGEEFVRGLLRGSAEISVGHATVHMETAARATAPFRFWAIECFWLFMALCGVLFLAKDLIRIARRLPEPKPSPVRPATQLHAGLLPEALAELVRTGRIEKESVPRLLKDLRPHLRTGDETAVLHNHVIEWVGVILGLFPLAGTVAVWIESPEADVRIFFTILLGGFAVGFPVGLMALAASWRRRRRRQMQWLLDREANYQAAHKSSVAPAQSFSAAP